jgi:hypothetical protein
VVMPMAPALHLLVRVGPHPHARPSLTLRILRLTSCHLVIRFVWAYFVYLLTFPLFTYFQL